MTYENAESWFKTKAVDYEGRMTENYYKNYDLRDIDIELMKEIARREMDKAVDDGKITDLQARGRTKGLNKIINNFIAPEITEDVDRVNEDYLTETRTIIERTTTLSQVEAVSIDLRYEDETQRDIANIIEDRKAEFEEPFLGRVGTAISLEDIRETIKEAPKQLRRTLRRRGQTRLKFLIRTGREAEGVELGRIS